MVLVGQGHDQRWPLERGLDVTWLESTTVITPSADYALNRLWKDRSEQWRIESDWEEFTYLILERVDRGIS